MSLVTLNTKLKSLKFGKDRPGGGSSSQPYIESSIPSGDHPQFQNPDVITRGGILAPLRAAKDVSRLTQLFTDFKNPTGGLYVLKENLLSRTAVKTEASFGVGYGMGTINSGIYTPLSALLQAGASGTGLHVNHLGINPLSPSSNDRFPPILPGLGLNLYEEVVTQKNIDGDNRLETLYSAKITKTRTIDPQNDVSGFEGEVLSYGGGPGSVLGVGNTVIRATKHRTNSEKALNIQDIEGPPQPRTLSPSQIAEKPNKQNIQGDFRKDIIEVNEVKSSSILSLSPDYITKNIHNRTYLGDPGKSNTKEGTKNVFNYGLKANEMVALDKLTALPIYSGEGPDTSKAINDLVKFRIAVLDNDSKNGMANYIHFRAFIDSFDDDYSANYTPVNYSGRGDTFFNYSSFLRTINLSFTVAAQSKAELIPMYKKLNYLASITAPDYTDSGFMRGNLIRLTLGGYLYEQYGILKGIRYTIPSESPWEIGINENGESDSSVKELPHIIKVSSFSFTPIHNFLARKSKDPNNPDERFISLSNAFNSKGNYEDEYPDYNA